MKPAEDIDLKRFPPTPADIVAGIVIAGRDIGPAIQQAESRYGPTVLVSAFVMLANILTSIGLGEEELVRLARQGARMELEQMQWPVRRSRIQRKARGRPPEFIARSSAPSRFGPGFLSPCRVPG
jgi:hypothetical protein